MSIIFHKKQLKIQLDITEMSLSIKKIHPDLKIENFLLLQQQDFKIECFMMNNGDILTLLKMNNISLYDNDLNQIRPDRYILLDEFLKENKDIKFISHDEFEFEVNDLNYDILKVIKKHKDDAGINPHALNPNYLKLTEAEEKFNESR